MIFNVPTDLPPNECEGAIPIKQGEIKLGEIKLGGRNCDQTVIILCKGV